MAKTFPTPAPVGGWNTRDAIAAMPEDTASILDNWFPNIGRVDIRPGYTTHATGLSGNIETLAAYESATNSIFIAAANGGFYNVTSAGAVGAALASGFTSNRWQHANMDGKIGFVNGTDTPQQYDGTTFGTMTLTGTGLTATNVIGINIFQSRSYFWEDNSQDFWYSAVDTLGGALTKFPLSRVGQFGGKLLAMGTWTRDAGDGMNDLAVFLMTSGEVIVYSGTNPGSDFSLIGIFRIGAPLSIRGIAKIGGDLVVILKDGYASLQKVINQDRVGDAGYISNQIGPSVTSVTQQYGDNFGWEVFHYPRGNMLIFNIPLATNATYNQHVFNTNTGAPCRFKGINARCWGLYKDKAYFGGSGVVYLFDNGFSDNGGAIDADALTAETYLNPKNTQKLLTAAQVIMRSDVAIALSIAIQPDFKRPDVAYRTDVVDTGSSDWDTATWDEATWTSGNLDSKAWYSMGSMGYSFRARVKIRENGQLVKWYSINYMYEPGGLI